MANNMNDNLSLCDLLDDAVAAQCTTSALVTKIRQLIEENTRLKAELRRYREREEIAHAEDAAPREPPREPPRGPPREPPREPTMEPPLTPRPSTAYGVTPQEWMGMYPYRHQTPRSVAPSIAAAQEVPVHMWRTPRTTLPRHPLCQHPARSLTPDTVVHPACGVAAGTPDAAMRGHPGGLEGTKLVGPLRGPRGSRQGREREPPLELTEGQGAGAGSEPLSSPYECPLFSTSFQQPPDSPDSGSLLSKQGKERDPPLELTAVAGADGRGTQFTQSAKALLEAKADLEELTAKALRELREQHGDELSAQWWVQQAAGGSDYYCALLEAGAHKDPSRSR